MKPIKIKTKVLKSKFKVSEDMPFQKTKFYSTIEERNKFTLDQLKTRLNHPDWYDPYYGESVDSIEQYYTFLVEECLEFIEELIK